MQVFSSRRNRRIAIVGILALTIALVGSYYALRWYAPFVFDATAMREWIGQFGIFAPLVFIGAQVLQVIFAPIPGQVAALVGGYLFGPLAGTAYSMVGVMVGSAIAFAIASRYGRPVVETLLHEDVVDWFDDFAETVGLPGLLLFVLIPGLPDDAICFLAGLAHFRLAVFVAIMAIGRLPAYLATNYAGDSIASGQFLEAVIIVGITVALSAIAYRNRERIRAFARDF